MSLTLALNATRGTWNQFASRRKKKKFLEFQQKVFERDDHTCQFCGFRSDKYQVTICKNLDFTDNSFDNLATCCQFCAQCLLLDGASLDKKIGGTIIYLPEISQTDLNHFTRVLFVSMLKDAPYRGKLQTTYLSFKDRSKIVEDVLGEGSSNPKIFGQSFIDSNITENSQNHPFMRNLRLLPHRKPFGEELAYWKDTNFKQIPL